MIVCVISISKGARYTGPDVTIDGNIITGNAPKSSRLSIMLTDLQGENT